MYKNHSNAIIIGKWLDLHEDQHGLYVKGELTPGHSLAEDVYASLKHGAVTGLSIGYRVVDSEPQNGITFLKEIDLIEVSVVNTPADLNAQISSVKEFNEALAEIEDIRALEKFFRDEFDLSQTKSKALITCIKGAMHERDVHSVEEDQRDVGSSTKASIESQLYEAIKNLKV
ncbi:Putative prohead protease [Salinisphaera sp. LB1]|nr:Putative prohead protease [Salinisphaera sp. LB1]